MKLIAFCTSMIPFSMVNTVDTSLTSYAKKFPALHAKEIFFDDTKKEYAIGARTRREVDNIAERLEGTDCRTDKEIIKHCIRIRVVCGEQIDMYSTGQLIVNPHHLIEENMASDNGTIQIERRTNLNNIESKVSKAIQRIKAVANHMESRSYSGLHLNDHSLKNAVAVVGDAAPYEVTIKNSLAKCSSIRVRWWKFHCHDCLVDGELLG
jgi:hypothetical protein